MIGMSSYWLHNKAPPHIQTVELDFPVTGHSFILPDRVFGTNEKVINKKEVIFSPKEYVEVIKKHSAVFHLREDYEIFDWKSYLKTILRNNVSWRFKIASCKRIIVLKRPRIIEVRGEPFYTVEVNSFKSLTKNGKNFNSINLPIIHSQIKINPKKMKDVEKLLNSHYGVDWRQDQNLEFYNKINLMRK